MNKKAFLLPLFVAGMAVAVAQPGEHVGAFAEYISKYSSKNNYIKAGSELNNKICDEGFTLLKNKDNYLPMSGAEYISVFGKSSTDLVYGGGGSGSGYVNGETAVDLQKSLTNAGFTINPSLTNFYKSNSKSGIGRTNGNSSWKGISQVQIGETPLDLYGDDLYESFYQYNDAAIMVISREGSEGCDVKTCDARDFDPKSPSGNNANTPVSDFSYKHALQLSDNEEALFNMIKENFDNVIILINSGNVFQCDQFENDDQVKAVLWIGTPGATGVSAVGRILTGEVNPSGHTVDTWARDFTKDPTFQNFSDNAQTNLTYDADGNEKFASQDTMFNPDGTPVRSPGTLKKANYKWEDEENLVVEAGLNGVKPSSYVSYEEGIYFDYRYYETKWHDMAMKGQKKADKWYNGQDKEHGGVIYPFGYGLSYTSFEQEITSISNGNEAFSNPNERVRVKVKVTNTGEVAGKDVVQLYWKAPYTKGGIEKAYEVLCAFDKTDILQPQESQELELTFYLADVANYDFSDANNNNFKGYELEGGQYIISANKNAHEVYNSVELNIAEEGIKFDKDRVTGHEVTNRFTDRGFYSSLPGENDIGFDQMTRGDIDGTFPTHPTIEDRTLKEGSLVQDYYTHEFSMKDIDVDHNTDYVPAAAHKTKEDIEALGWTQRETSGNPSNPIQFSSLAGVPMDDPRWDAFLNQMSWSEMIPFVLGGRDQNPAISWANKPGTGSSDGPSQFLIIWWAGAPIVAATYNTDLAHEQGEMVGIESHLNGTFGWAGPACNIHRSPFGGRNFEYYSADPFLSGRMCGRVVSGATEKGVYCYFKHFAVNDQEKNREGVSSFLTEQALREIYLKPFQMAVQEGKATGIMSSYNRLGLMETAASYPLLTEVLRDEWGFTGSIISDMTHSGNGNVNYGCYENIHNRVLAGCNNQLDSNGFASNLKVTEWDKTLHAPVFDNGGTKVASYSFWYAVRKSVKETLYMVIRSGAMTRNTVVTQNDDIKLQGEVKNFVEVEVNKAADVEVLIPDELKVGATYNGNKVSSIEISVDNYTPLPEGLSIQNGKIVGTPTATANQFVRLIVKFNFEGGTSTTMARAFELRVVDQIVESEMAAPTPIQEIYPVGGSSAPIGLILGIVGGVVVLAAAAVVVVLVLKKKKKTA